MRQRIFATLFLCAVGATALGTSNVDPAHQFAWGENVGWLNWRDANGGLDGVCVHATFLSGFVWSENVGFLNLGDGSPGDGSSYANVDGADFGVNIDANGELYGLAWGENIGWINFDTRTALGAFTQQARLDRSANRLRGYAWGENVGWINLDDADAYVGFGLSTPADFDGDSDVDLADFGQFQACFNGPNRSPAQSGCDAADFDNDDDVDLGDFGVFQSCFNGPNRPAACG